MIVPGRLKAGGGNGRYRTKGGPQSFEKRGRKEVLAARVSVVALIVGVTTLGIPAHEPAAATPAAARQAAVSLGERPRPIQPLVVQQRLPWRANMLGLSWRAQDPEAEGVWIFLRTRSGDDWSEPIRLFVEEHEGPDPGHEPQATDRVFTLPVWVGTVEEVIVTIRVERDSAPIRDVRVEAINTLGDAEAGSLPVRVVRAVGRFLTSTAVEPAAAAPKRPKIIRRAGWGADESLGSSGPGVASELRMAFVHHTAGNNSYTASQSAAIVRGIHRYHTVGLGYSDIAYNFLVDRYGQVFEGRKGGIGKAVIGAHAGGFNTFSTGVALMGTFGSVSPRKAMIDSLVALLAWKFDRHFVRPKGTVTMIAQSNGSRYSKGDQVSLRRIAAHRHASATACPGAMTMNLLPSIRDRVEKRGNPKIYNPRLNRDLIRPSGDGVLERTRARAAFSRRVDWTWRVLDGADRSVFSAGGRGKKMDVRWDGVGRDGLAVAPGRYRWRLEATRTSNGRRARPATGFITVMTRQPESCAGCSPGAVADFNGNGFEDLAIGVPGENLKKRIDAGAVHVLYGTTGGPTAEGNRLIREDALGGGSLEAGARFGSSLAAGDFNGDGYADLAIGAPFSNVGGARDAGAVTIVFGSATGLRFGSPQRFTLAGLGRSRVDGAAFGSALAVGDLDGDGVDDLLIGAPGARVKNRPGAGIVAALYGSGSGLVRRGTTVWRQNRPGLWSKPQAGDRFGAALSSADIDGDGRHDAVIGVPGEGVGGKGDAGAVQVLFGGAGGLSSDGAQSWHLDRPAGGIGAAAGDTLGFAVAAGDLNGNGRADVALGIPGRAVGGAPGAGAVAVLPGSPGGLIPSAATIWHAEVTGVPGEAGRAHGFGSSLVTGRFNSDAHDDLAIGTPGDVINGHPDAGSVTVLYGSAAGLTIAGAQRWHQNSGLTGAASEGELFGASLAAGDFNANGRDELVIGVPGRTIAGVPNAGVAHVLFSSTTRLSGGGSQRWHQNRPGVRNSVQPGDMFGSL